LSIRDDLIQAQIQEIKQQYGDDFEDFLSFEIPDVEFEYEQPNEDDGCEGGACKI
jgi:hypothetical protein